MTLRHSDTITRWNSTFYLIARTLDLKKALVPTLASQIGLESEVEFSSRDWDLMNKIITVLKPFEKATKLLQNSQGVKTMKKSLSNAMLSCFSDVENDEKFTISSFCDPRIKCSLFRENSTKKRCIEIMTQFIQNKLQNVALVPSNQSTTNDESHISFENHLKKQCMKLQRKIKILVQMTKLTYLQTQMQ